MENFEISFEKIFAIQIAKMINQFPENIVETLFKKKDSLKNKVKSLNLDLNLTLEKSVPFVPVIPINVMKSIEQVSRLVSNEALGQEIYHHHLSAFFYYEESAYNLSPTSEVGFLIDVKTLPASSFKINPSYSKTQTGTALREEIKKLDYIPTNHTEAFIIACLTNLLPHEETFCAINFSWDDFDFAEIYHSRKLRYGLRWEQLPFEKGEYVQRDYKILIPIYKEFI